MYDKGKYDHLVFIYEPQCEKYALGFFFQFEGSWGALTSNAGVLKCNDREILSPSRHMHNKGKNSPLFYMYGPQCDKMYILSPISIDINKIWKQSDKHFFKLS